MFYCLGFQIFSRFTSLPFVLSRYWCVCSIMRFELNLIFSVIGMAVWVTDSLNRAKTGDHFAATLVGLRSKYLFIVTLAENLLCTSMSWFRCSVWTSPLMCSVLIAYKIWSIQREVASFAINKKSKHQQNLSGIIVIITESGKWPEIASLRWLFTWQSCWQWFNF